MAAERERLRHAEGLRRSRGRRPRRPGRSRRGRRRRGGGAGRGRIAAAGAPRASTPASTRSPSGSRRSASSWATSARSCATTPRASRPTRAALLGVEERLEAIDRLERKHGGSVESVLAHAERCRAEIARLEGAEVRGAEAEAALAEAEERRAGAGRAAERRARPMAAGRWKSGSPPSWSGSRWPARTLEVVLEPHPDGYGANGRETVELRVAPNPGIEAAPLRDAASGGELSRVMLALSGLGQAASAGTLVFDEIDAGIGGNTARVVGERLRALGDGPPGPLHHPPAPGRLARRRPLPAREGRRRRAGRRHGRAARRRGRGRGDPPHARRRALRRGRHPPRPRAARRRPSRPRRRTPGCVSRLAESPVAAWPNLSGWPPPVVVAFLLCSGVATERGRTRRSTAPPASASGPSTWSSACGPATSPSSTTSTSTGSPPRS